MKASDFVDGERLWRRHVEMAAIGGLPKGGVDRQALSKEDIAARNLLMEWARARNYDVFCDPIGNLYVRRDGAAPDAAPVATGSHMDSQPTGGKYDGIYGVLAGLEALEAMDTAGIRTRRPIDVVARTNEEGGRFQPGAMGSGLWAGRYDLAKTLDICDRAGTRLGDALAATFAGAPCRRLADFPPPFHAYIEPHIEQGPELERRGKTIGAVTGIQGLSKFAVDIEGEEAHAGTTPIAARKDALMSAIDIVAALRRHTHDPKDVTRFTVGRFECKPGSPNTVPGHVHFSIDLRHPDGATLSRLGDGLSEVARAAAGACRVTVTRVSAVAPTVFETGIVDLVRRTAAGLGLPSLDLPSGAGHDAMHVAARSPAGMIFVPCKDGISHNEAESATPADLRDGARVLADCLVALAENLTDGRLEPTTR